MKVVCLRGFQLEHIFNCQDTDLPSPHPPPAFKTDLPQRAGEGFSYMPWLILTCHWQVGTREFPAPSEAFNLQKEKTIKVLVLLGRREGPAATLQLWHIRFSITKKWQFCTWAYTNLRLTSCSSMLQHKFILTFPAQTLPGISTLFICLSVHPSESQGIPVPFSPFHSLTSLKMLPLQPIDQWGLKVVQLWPATMLAKYPFPAKNQAVFCFLNSWTQSSR